MSLCVAVLLLAAPAAVEDVAYTRFVYEDFDRGGLYTATVTMCRADIDVELVGVVHIADRAYYEDIQRELDGCDVVFYEMVVGDPREALSEVSALQLGVGRALQLSFQLMHIDYRSPAFVHSDLTWADIRHMLGETDAPPPPRTDVLPRLVPQLKLDDAAQEDAFTNNPALGRSIKVFLGQLLGDLPSTLAQLNLQDNGEDILISARNRRAMEIMTPHLSGRRRLALFWGAAHMPDFARRLASLGFRPVRVRWHLAWKIGDVRTQRWF